MAIGKKTGGRDFKKGECGNPNGRPPLPADLKASRSVNQAEFERVLNRYLFLKREELKELAKDMTLPTLDHLAIALLTATIDTGDYKRFNFLLERTIGKVKTVVEVVGNNGGPVEVSEETREEREERLRKRVKQLGIIDDEL